MALLELLLKTTPNEGHKWPKITRKPKELEKNVKNIARIITKNRRHAFWSHVLQDWPKVKRKILWPKFGVVLPRAERRKASLLKFCCSLFQYRWKIKREMKENKNSLYYPGISIVFFRSRVRLIKIHSSIARYGRQILPAWVNGPMKCSN